MCLMRLVNKVKEIMAKADPKDFLLNTDYEMDKIILAKTGDFTGSVEFNHGLKFTPLIFGVWATNKDFTSPNTIGIVQPAEPIPGLYTPPLGVGCKAYSDKILLEAGGENAATTKIYYRVYAFTPDKENSNTPQTSKLANKFILNTDYNYRKLKASGEFTQAGQTYNHNLGYIPQVMAWIKYADLPELPFYSNAIEPVVDISEVTDYGLIITKNTIKADNNFPFGLIDKIMWRVYYDEA